MIVIRLVRHDDPLSWAIIQNIGGEIAHAETILPGGKVIGAYAEGGVQERSLDSDGGKYLKEILCALPADSDMMAKFEHYLRACIGEPYDFPGIANFTHLGIDLHAKHHVFCSTLMVDALRGCEYFARPLPIPAHYVNPLMLQQMLFVRPDVSVITRDDPVFIAHISAGT